MEFAAPPKKRDTSSSLSIAFCSFSDPACPSAMSKHCTHPMRQLPFTRCRFSMSNPLGFMERKGGRDFGGGLAQARKNVGNPCHFQSSFCDFIKAMLALPWLPAAPLYFSTLTPGSNGPLACTKGCPRSQR